MKSVKNKLIRDTLILGLASIILSAMGLGLQVFLSHTLGTDGVGLFQLICSVYIFATTFATSGISLSVTRIITEAYINEKTAKTVHSMFNRCMCICILLGSCACALQFIFSPYIASSILGHQDTTNCFRILAFGLPFMSISSCINGFFIAERHAPKSAFAYVFEDAIKLIFVFSIFYIFPPKDDISGCIILTFGVVFSEICSCTLSYFMYRHDKRNAKIRQKASPGTIKQMLRIGAPVATSSYLKSGLTTLENLLVPLGLQKYGMSVLQSLSIFGTFRGLVIPVLLFPSSIILAFTRVYMPEIADAFTVRNYKKINNSGTKVLSLTLIFSVFITGIFIIFADELCTMIFGSCENAHLLRILSPLIPIMYMDGVVDGILKGMDEQFAVMRYNVYEAIIRVIIVYFVLPHTGITGFIITIYAGNTVNTILSFLHLIKITNIRPSITKTIILPFISVLTCGLFMQLLFKHFWSNVWLYSIAAIICSGLLYLILLMLLECLNVPRFLRIKNIGCKTKQPINNK